MINTQTSIVKSETPFQFHESFVGWKGVEYTEETVNGKRHYTINGVAYPSITTVLSYDPDKIRALARWRRSVGQENASRISKAASTRGTKLHKLCEDYLSTNEVEIKTYEERENFFKVKNKLEHHVGKIYCMETALYSEKLGVAGRTDLIADFVESGYSIPAVIDFKTSTKTKYRSKISQYFIQGAAYATMFHEMTGIEVPKIAIIIVTEELPEPQIFLEDVSKWMQPLENAINVYRESIQNVAPQPQGLSI